MERKSGMEEDKEFLKGVDLSRTMNIGRPPCKRIDPNKDDIILMQIDVDYYTAVPPGK